MREDQAVKKQVERIIQEIRPVIEADGDKLSLVGVEDGIARLKMTVPECCADCIFAEWEFRQIITATLKRRILDLKEVVFL